MTFDFASEIRRAYWHNLRNYRPSPNPPVGFPPTWYIPGWCASFVTPDDDVDVNYSVNTIKGVDGRSYICPGRPDGTTYWGDYTWTLANYQQIVTGTGVVSAQNIPNPSDPALDGNNLVLNTGAQSQSVAGVRRWISGSLPANYGVMLMPNVANVGSDPLNALNVVVQDGSGRSMVLRFYDNNVDLLTNERGFTSLLAHCPPGQLWEIWIENALNSNGTSTITPWAGTEKIGGIMGTLPLNFGGTPNSTLTFTQQCKAGFNNRESHVKQVQVGISQTPGSMIAVSKPMQFPSFSPARGKIIIHVEDVSVSVNPNGNFRAYVAKETAVGSYWVQVTLEEDLTPYLNTTPPQYVVGEIDNTKRVRRFGGSALFPTGSGRSIRWMIQSDRPTFGVIQSVDTYWDIA